MMGLNVQGSEGVRDGVKAVPLGIDGHHHDRSLGLTDSHTTAWPHS